MRIVNSEITLSKPDTPTSEYFETALKERNIDFIRWAIVSTDEESCRLNVSYRVPD